MEAVADQTAGQSVGTSAGFPAGSMIEEESHQLSTSDLELSEE